MIRAVSDLIARIQEDLCKWDSRATPWFRGESGDGPALQPKVARLSANQENCLLQSFRRRAGSLANTPSRSETDNWMFLAQHYGIPTRLLDWSEGALFALFFAVNRKARNARVHMLNPHVLNAQALGCEPDYLNFPISWSPSSGGPKPGYENIALAWELRREGRGFDLPVALEPTYQDARMIAQRSAFTVHGKELGPLITILQAHILDVSKFLFSYTVEDDASDQILKELSWLGISYASIFPDLDHLCLDIANRTACP